MIYIQMNTIKIQHQSFSNETNSHGRIDFLNFHNEESFVDLYPIQNSLLSVQYSQPKIIEIVKSEIDLRTTPLLQINKYIEDNYQITRQQLEEINRRILKIKRNLKKMRAKDRSKRQQNTASDSVSTVNCIDLTNDDEAEKKKKKNRISAQTSRDRKKQYLQNLEKQNNQLRLNLQRQRQHKKNQQLKTQIQNNLIKGESYQETRYSKLLMFLGTAFLFMNSKSKIKNNKKDQILGMDSLSLCNSVLEKGKTIFQNFNESQINHNFKSLVFDEIQKSRFNQNQVQIPAEIFHKLVETAKLHLN